MGRPARDGSRQGSERTAEELARGAQAGSSEDFAGLVRLFAGPLHSFLALRCAGPEEAEELAQETFVRAWQKLERYDPRRRFSTWLFTIARRAAIGRLRARRGASIDAEALEGFAAGEDPARAAGEREERRNLWRVAARVLTIEQRSALWLRYAEDFSAAEIARVLGRCEATVRVLLFRARKELARHLEEPRGRPREEDGSWSAPPALPATLAARRAAGGR